MLYQSEDIAQEHVKQHRQQLLDEAHAHRQARCERLLCSPPTESSRPRRSDRLLHATGSLLVRWGTRLQQTRRGHTHHICRYSPGLIRRTFQPFRRFRMLPLPRRCPLTGGPIVVTRFYCPDTDVSVEGRFAVETPPFAQLSPDQLKFERSSCATRAS